MIVGIIIAIVAIALVFDFTNGFHDAANAIATSISTRALTPRVALGMAAVMNLLGAFLGRRSPRRSGRDHRHPAGATGDDRRRRCSGPSPGTC